MRGAAVKLLVIVLLWCFAARPLLHSCNNFPWPDDLADNPLAPAETAPQGERYTLFSSFSSQIKTLDPQLANFVHEHSIIDNIVETPLHYHYLKRPYAVEPRLLAQLPVPRHYDHAGALLTGDPAPDAVARTEYILKLRPGILFAPHPAFSAAPDGRRELSAADFKTAFVRLCDPALASPVYSSFNSFLSGMPQCSELIAQEHAAGRQPVYAEIPFAGCSVIDRYTLKVTLHRKYPQFLYWLTMRYTAPIAQEVLDYYSKDSSGLSYADWPVGTGAFMLESCDPNRRIILTANPHFLRRGECYPRSGEESDRSAGLLDYAGHPLPMLKRAVFNYERESIPNWLKFRQGYYDHSGIPNDMFDSAVAVAPGGGELTLSPEMAARGMTMTSSIPPISYYFAFNMRDPVVGGLSDERCALRQALSIVIDPREYIAIFKNGNGIPAESIIPPGLFGAAAPPQRINRILNDWDENSRRTHRKSMEHARALMKRAGYPDGIDPATGAPLVIHLDHAAAGLPDFKNRFQWLAARFRLLGVELVERPSDLNRNRDNLKTGNWQFLFERAWVADYPDPENFLMLFYSGNAHAGNAGSGPNYSNYASPRFDALFTALETMPDSPQRLALIGQALDILAEDAPVCTVYHPVNTTLTHAWLKNAKPHGIANDTLQYLAIDTPEERTACQQQWNRPHHFPLYAFFTLLTALLLLPHLLRRF